LRIGTQGVYSASVRFLSIVVALVAPVRLIAADAAAEFSGRIRPVLEQNCAGCHNPQGTSKRVNFLASKTVDEIQDRRGQWASAAVQLRNRTMPPAASKLSEEDRLAVTSWIDNRLRETACSAGPWAGAAPPRRLNRREYRNTVRDLLGVDLAVADVFPADETGGAGFDTNADTLYIPPMMVERYMEAAGKILDRVIVTPPLNRVFPSAGMAPAAPSTKPGRDLAPGQEVSTEVTVFNEGQYNLRVNVERPRQTPFQMHVKVDGGAVGSLNYQRDLNGGATTRIQTVTLERGVHKVAVVTGEEPVVFYSLTVEQRPAAASPDKAVLHQRLFGLEPGEAPVDGRVAARRVMERFVERAYRRPVAAADVEPFLALYERASRRGDPYEESVKLALKAVLVSPRFLFRVEDVPAGREIRQLGQYEMASRLSYFLWATAPDDELLRLAAAGRLQDDRVLAGQVDRMLDDPRSRQFATAFTGQWLGTQDVGGRAVPLLTELQHFYTPEVSVELRQEPVMLFHHLLSSNGSLLDLIGGNYSFLTARLARYYQVEDKFPALGDRFERVAWPDNRRAGVLGMAGVLALTSHYRMSSPVLRGAWVLDTLLGTPVPAPPPDVPPLEKASKSEKGLTMKQILARHRADPACSTCHNLMDPIGFGLEPFDWMGRFQEKPVDAAGVLPSGEKFDGPVELREVLLRRKSDFVRHLAGKVLGYATGRPVQDGDHCTVQKLAAAVERDGYRARTLVREVVLSLPFRAAQGGVEISSSGPRSKRSTRLLLGEK